MVMSEEQGIIHDIRTRIKLGGKLTAKERNFCLRHFEKLGIKREVILWKVCESLEGQKS